MSLCQSLHCHEPGPLLCPPALVAANPAPKPPGLGCDRVFSDQHLPRCFWLWQVTKDGEGSTAAAQVQVVSRSSAQSCLVSAGWFLLLLKQRQWLMTTPGAYISEVFVPQRL